MSISGKSSDSPENFLDFSSISDGASLEGKWVVLRRDSEKKNSYKVEYFDKEAAKKEKDVIKNLNEISAIFRCANLSKDPKTKTTIEKLNGKITAHNTRYEQVKWKSFLLAWVNSIRRFFSSSFRSYEPIQYENPDESSGSHLTSATRATGATSRVAEEVMSRSHSMSSSLGDTDSSEMETAGVSSSFSSSGVFDSPVMVDRGNGLPIQEAGEGERDSASTSFSLRDTASSEMETAGVSSPVAFDSSSMESGNNQSIQEAGEGERDSASTSSSLGDTASSEMETAGVSSSFSSPGVFDSPSMESGNDQSIQETGEGERDSASTSFSLRDTDSPRVISRPISSSSLNVFDTEVAALISDRAIQEKVKLEKNKLLEERKNSPDRATKRICCSNEKPKVWIKLSKDGTRLDLSIQDVTRTAIKIGGFKEIYAAKRYCFLLDSEKQTVEKRIADFTHDIFDQIKASAEINPKDKELYIRGSEIQKTLKEALPSANIDSPAAPITGTSHRAMKMRESDLSDVFIKGAIPTSCNPNSRSVPLTPEIAIDLMIPLVQTLKMMHETPINEKYYVHGDFKPKNVLLKVREGPEGTVVTPLLIDFDFTHDVAADWFPADYDVWDGVARTVGWRTSFTDVFGAVYSLKMLKDNRVAFISRFIQKKNLKDFNQKWGSRLEELNSKDFDEDVLALLQKRTDIDLADIEVWKKEKMFIRDLGEIIEKVYDQSEKFTEKVNAIKLRQPNFKEDERKEEEDERKEELKRCQIIAGCWSAEELLQELELLREQLGEPSFLGPEGDGPQFLSIPN